MVKQSTTVITVVKNGEIKKIGRSVIFVPKLNFNGGETKWYEEERIIHKRLEHS